MRRCAGTVLQDMCPQQSSHACLEYAAPLSSCKERLCHPPPLKLVALCHFTCPPPPPYTFPLFFPPPPPPLTIATPMPFPPPPASLLAPPLPCCSLHCLLFFLCYPPPPDRLPCCPPPCFCAGAFVWPTCVSGLHACLGYMCVFDNSVAACPAPHSDSCMPAGLRPELRTCEHDATAFAPSWKVCSHQVREHAVFAVSCKDMCLMSNPKMLGQTLLWLKQVRFQ